MKFKLPRQIISKEASEIVSRELKRQKIPVHPLLKKDLIAIRSLAKTIRKKGLPKHLIRKKLPDNMGYGIFLHPKAKPILKGEIIAPYAGEVSIVDQKLPDDAVYAFAPIEDLILTKKEQSGIG